MDIAPSGLFCATAIGKSRKLHDGLYASENDVGCRGFAAFAPDPTGNLIALSRHPNRIQGER